MKSVIDILYRLVRLILNFQQFRSLKEDEGRIEIVRLKDCTIRRLRVTSFASDL